MNPVAGKLGSVYETCLTFYIFHHLTALCEGTKIKEKGEAQKKPQHRFIESHFSSFDAIVTIPSMYLYLAIFTFYLPVYRM
jgi:hypothetical protein